MNKSLENTEMTAETESLNETTVNKELKTTDKPNKFVSWIKEFFRKFMVGLKRRPQNIAMVIYVVALLVYTLNLTAVSDSTAYINKSNMGLCQFVAVLFSILGFVCMINVYPRRAKTNYIMLAIFFVMMIIVIVCDIIYRGQLMEGIYVTHSADLVKADWLTKYSYLFTVKSMLVAHVILIGVAFLAFALAPLIGKLLSKVNTSVDIEYTDNMGAIEREDD